MYIKYCKTCTNLGKVSLYWIDMGYGGDWKRDKEGRRGEKRRGGGQRNRREREEKKKGEEKRGRGKGGGTIQGALDPGLLGPSPTSISWIRNCWVSRRRPTFSLVLRPWTYDVLRCCCCCWCCRLCMTSSSVWFTSASLAARNSANQPRASPFIPPHYWPCSIQILLRSSRRPFTLLLLRLLTCCWDYRRADTRVNAPITPTTR